MTADERRTVRAAISRARDQQERAADKDARQRDRDYRKAERAKRPGLYPAPPPHIPKQAPARCPWCGQPTRHGRPCREHRALEHTHRKGYA